jgi:outer membrane protein OmpA-like peptidoglycan-associated protein
VNPAQKQPAHNVSLGADGLFAFGKSSLNDLQPEGRMKLERLSQQIREGYNLESITVTGHTDRIGSAASNLMLSQARANTVKAYLVAQGVPAHLITATGVGSTQPLVTCNGPKSASVIACLQQNRRVEIAINGSVKQ